MGGNDPFSAFRAPSPTLSQSSSSVGGFPGSQQPSLLNSGGQNSGVGLNSNQLGGIGVSGLSGLSSGFSSLGQNGDFLGGSLLQSSRSLLMEQHLVPILCLPMMAVPMVMTHHSLRHLPHPHSIVCHPPPFLVSMV